MRLVRYALDAQSHWGFQTTDGRTVPTGITDLREFLTAPAVQQREPMQSMLCKSPATWSPRALPVESGPSAIRWWPAGLNLVTPNRRQSI